MWGYSKKKNFEKERNIFLTFMSSNFLEQTLQYLKKYILLMKSWKTPSKVAQKTFFSLLPLAKKSGKMGQIGSAV